MITTTKQNWNVGSTVKVGFMSLIIKASVYTPGDYLPDAYILSNIAGTQLYKFVPHNGLEKVTVSEVKELLSDAEKYSTKIATKAIANIMAAVEIGSLFA